MGNQESKSTTVVNNTIRGAIKAVMTTSVDSSVNLACSNQQIVKGAEGCDIEFADQMCKAVGISNFTGSQEQTSNVSQDVMNEVVAGAAAATEGMTVGQNKSESNTHVQNLVNMSMDVAQAFMTDCTRNIQAINTQAVEGCSAGTVVRFKPQDISAEVIGECVSNQVGSLTAAQKITNAISATSEATTKGIDFFTIMIIIVVCAFLFLAGIPFAAKAMSSAVLGEGAEAARTRGNLWITGILGVSMFLMMLFWWPGIPMGSGAWALGVWPHEPTWVSDDNPDCLKGQNMKRDTFINEYIWYDPFCLASLAVGGEIGSCPEKNKMKYYHGCGLFADSPGCDDNQFIQDRDEYIEAVKACGDPVLAGVGPLKYCSAANLTKVFSNIEDAYDGCERCLEGEVRGMWVKEGGACSAANLNFYDYTRYIDGDENTACDPGDAHCKETEAILANTSPDECMNSAYQRRKKVFSQALRACDRIDDVAKVNTASNGGVKPPMADQCPPDMFDYLTKCSPTDKKCGYVAKGCTGCDAEGNCADCSAADPLVVGSCRNDYSVCCHEGENGVMLCNDQDYAKDLDAYNLLNAQCAAKWEAQSGFDYAPHISMATYALMGTAVLAIWLRAPPGVKTLGRSGLSQMFSGGGSTTITESRSFKGALFFLMLVTWFAAGFPVGVLSLVHAGWPVSLYTVEDKESRDGWDGMHWLIIGWALLGLSTLGMMYMVYRAAFYKTKTVAVAAPVKERE